MLNKLKITNIRTTALIAILYLYNIVLVSYRYLDMSLLFVVV